MTAPVPPAMPVAHPAQAVYFQPAAPRNGLGLTAMILGIIGLVFCLIPITGMVVGGPLSILAIIFGAVGWSRARKGTATNRKVAIAGFVLGIAAFVFACVDLGIVTSAVNDLGNCLDATSNALNHAGDSGAQAAQSAACDK